MQCTVLEMCQPTYLHLLSNVEDKVCYTTSIVEGAAEAFERELESTSKVA